MAGTEAAASEAAAASDAPGASSGTEAAGESAPSAVKDGPTGFQRWLLPSLARKHDQAVAALEAEAAERQRVKDLHDQTDKAYKELHRHAREKHKEKTRENFSLEQQLEYAITTELKLRAEVDRLERALQLTQHDLGNARYELASLGEEWRLDEGRARSLVRTHELGHLQLCDHLESAVDALSRWRGDGDRLCDALDDALVAVGVQREVDEAARVARETKAVGGSTRGLGDAAAAEQRELAAELAQQRAFVAEIRQASQLHQQQELSALILKSPEKRRELQTRLKEIHDHREAVCGVWPNLNVGNSPPSTKQSAKEGTLDRKPTPKAGRRARVTGATAAASAERSSASRSSPSPSPMRSSPMRTPPSQGRRATKATTALDTGSEAAAAGGTPSIATTKRVNRFKKAPSAVATGHAESRAVVIAASAVDKRAKRPGTPTGSGLGSGGGRMDGIAQQTGATGGAGKRPGSAASLAGSVPVWNRPDSAGSISVASRPSTAGSRSRPGTANSMRRPPTPEQVASQAAVRAALTVQQSDGAASSRRSGADSSVQLLENSHDTSGQVQQNDIDQIGRAMVEATSRSQNVWRNAGRPGDDSEMVRQVLALQGFADAAENVLPPVLLLARADTVGASIGPDGSMGEAPLSLTDAQQQDDEDEDMDSDSQALRLNRFEWGTEEWSQATVPIPNYTVRSKDGFSAHVNGFDPSTACAATLLRPRPLGDAAETDVGALVVCGEVTLDENDSSETDHQVLQLYEPPLQEWCGLPAPTVPRRFPVLLGLADGSLLLVCGYDKGGSLIKSAEILHQRPPAEGEEHRRRFDAWKSAGRLAAGRDGFAIGQLDDGRVIVAGGTHYPYGVVESGLRTAEMWVPATNAWQKIPSMNDGHGYCAGCRMADNRFMVSGGYDPQGVPSSKVEAYNPATFEWEPLADLPRPARDHKMCAVPGGVLLTTVGGGAMLYDAESDHWHAISQDDPTRFQPLLLHCETGDADD